MMISGILKDAAYNDHVAAMSPWKLIPEMQQKVFLPNFTIPQKAGNSTCQPAIKFS
jgi:hypothetical protein